jgi:hypothetical protein
MNDKLITSFVLLLSVSGCASMTWHEGSMIQYSNIEPLESGGFNIEVLGGWDHDQSSLERAVIIKAEKLCKSDAKVIFSQMGTYYSSTTGGGVSASGNPPKIITEVQCVDKDS